MKTGILMHVYNLDTFDWENLVWGSPADDRMGSIPTLVWLIVTQPADAPVTNLAVGCSASRKDSLSESEYTVKFMLDHFESLADFPRLKPLLGALSDGEKRSLYDLLASIVQIPLPQTRSTLDEVAKAADIFYKQGVDKVIQICSASHAPRCVQVQATVRRSGHISPAQQWLLMPTEVTFNGNALRPDETIVLEPPHRADDPMLHVRPSLGQTLRPAMYASPEEKKELIALVKDFLKRRQIQD